MNGIKGVILNLGDDPVPKDDRLIDLSNKTRLGESIEITKRSCAYVGIDTSLSVMAAYVLPRESIIVCTTNVILWEFRHTYYASHTDFDFIVPYLGATKEDKEKWRALASQAAKEEAERNRRTRAAVV